MSQGLNVDAVVIGAGVVGLAVATALSKSLDKVVVVERLRTFGLETSSRSSEVIHGGLYYEPGSNKAELCIEGAALVYERAERLGIPVAKRGKLVVATESDQEESLKNLFDNANACGARGIQLWGRAKIGREEPRVNAVAALHSPWTGVVDSQELMRSFHVEARAGGVDFAYRHELKGLTSLRRGWLCELRDSEGVKAEVSSSIVINSAGLGSDMVAAIAGIDIDEAGYRLKPCKGDYFSLSGHVFQGISRLIYPLPDPHHQVLGVHLTVDIAGRGRLGPDATYLSLPLGDNPYFVEETKRAHFVAAGRRILPWLRSDDLEPERSGIRPRLSAPSSPLRDFVICHEVDRGLSGLVNLIGIDSPGLTSAPAIGRKVVEKLRRDGVI